MNPILRSFGAFVKNKILSELGVRVKPVQSLDGAMLEPLAKLK
jgi:hypothetical protein